MCVSEAMRLVVWRVGKRVACWMRCADLDRNVEHNDWSKASDELGVGVYVGGLVGGGRGWVLEK